MTPNNQKRHRRCVARRQPKRLAAPRPEIMTLDQILAWADGFSCRTWPLAELHQRRPCVKGTISETWTNLDMALRRGNRGLLGGSSLARLLAERRGRRNPAQLPPWSVEQILDWADAFHAEHGRWPMYTRDKRITKNMQETWKDVDANLRGVSRTSRRFVACSTCGGTSQQTRTVHSLRCAASSKSWSGPTHFTPKMAAGRAMSRTASLREEMRKLGGA